MNPLAQPLASLGRTGKALEKKLKPLGIETCEDLIFYFPRRFDDFSLVLPIADLRTQITATIRGRIDMIANRRSRRSRMIVTEALVSDASGSIKIVWFNQPFLTKNLQVGDWLSLSGKTSDHYYDLQMVSPVYEKTGSGAENGVRIPDTVFPSLHTARLVPVYSFPANVAQKQFRLLMRTALDRCLPFVKEWLPDDIRAHERYPDLSTALLSIHFPEKQEEYCIAEQRFKFEELFLLQLYCKNLKESLAAQTSCAIPFDQKITKRLIAALPFTLTKEQKTVAWEILCDIQKATPMNRLLQGDVGSGKTIVAILAMLNVVHAGYQCAFMAPTEVLARQHFTTLKKVFADFDVRIALFTAQHHELRIKNQELRIKDYELRDTIANGGVDIVIGTHALIQEKISFKNLAFVIVDEQHRFGVNQRKALREKNSAPITAHVLSMTATPIPRSLALTVYGDLDISTIRALPKGRKKIITKIVPQSYRAWTYDFIRKHVRRGRQAFIVCPIIDQSDILGVRSVKEEYKKLIDGPFRHERVEMLHGRIKTAEKERVMAAFRDHEIDILVTTSVVEVGIDVPNATIVFIEGAERFGLASLHQLRGRVGRADHQSYCFLAPTDEDKEEISRLKAVVSSHDGFALAEKDLALRGEGDILGLRQSGMPRLKIATLTDIELIIKAREYAAAYHSKLNDHPELKNRIATFQDTVHIE
ncbi:ATP-dependent DNA helicase RecG [Candidatus Uhrbacteria bacterium]|nr:ATP-dependent DNA helicase RecG [Candidatus Uhrbacteria bacterium]